ncbi:MAG: acyltransferase family protein, partial [Bacteroidales bacterium]|nr:acyltransferase family protein [Candidatus Sodaliphilus fimicaballi]
MKQPNSVSTERNNTLDIMRLVAAFFVVCLHTTDHAFGDNQTVCTLLNAFSRFAVPFFFVITGYYFDRIKIDKYVLKIIN